MNIEMIIIERKQKTLTVMNTNKLTPKEMAAIKAQKLMDQWMNA